MPSGRDLSGLESPHTHETGEYQKCKMDYQWATAAVEGVGTRLQGQNFLDPPVECPVYLQRLRKWFPFHMWQISQTTRRGSVRQSFPKKALLICSQTHHTLRHARSTRSAVTPKTVNLRNPHTCVMLGRHLSHVLRCT